MSPAEYQKAAARAMPSMDPMKAGLHGALGLCAEVQEYLEAVDYFDYLLDHYPSNTKLMDTHSRMAREAKEYVMRELGDIWWMVAELCTANGIDLEDMMCAGILGDSSLASDAARIAGMYQKTFQGHEIPMNSLKLYVGDICTILGTLCRDYGKLGEIWQMNIDKLLEKGKEG